MLYIFPIDSTCHEHTVGPKQAKIRILYFHSEAVFMPFVPVEGNIHATAGRDIHTMSCFEATVWGWSFPVSTKPQTDLKELDWPAKRPRPQHHPTALGRTGAPTANQTLHHWEGMHPHTCSHIMCYRSKNMHIPENKYYLSLSSCLQTAAFVIRMDSLSTNSEPVTFCRWRCFLSSFVTNLYHAFHSK